MVATLVGVFIVLLVGKLLRVEVFDEMRLFSLHWAPIDQIGAVLSAIAKAGMQQLVLLGFLWPIARELVAREEVAGVLAAGIFGLAHLPHPTLAAATFFAGWAWIVLYHRGRSFGAIVVSHMVIAASVYAALPERTLHNLHVGAKAVERAPKYLRLETAKARRVLDVVCEDSFLLDSADTETYVARIFREIVGRGATPAEVVEWSERAEHLSRCSAAKMLVMAGD